MGKIRSLAFGLIVTLLAAGSSLDTVAAGELPVPCAPCNVTPGAPLGWISSGVASPPVVTGNNMTVTAGTSAQPNVTLNWQSFNISAGNSVTFVQPGATAIALNRIFQADPSRIFGNLTANGQIYLINTNGIIFGSPDGTPSQVNVGGLVASSLAISDIAAKNGILAPIQVNQAAFSGTTGYVQVNPGATLKTADGGRVAIFAPQVVNNGHIETPDGQTLLAAGESVFLLASDDPNLRGLLVGVDQGGLVTNAGTILASEGNITLAGLAVNQMGRVTATTSVTKGGSVSLLARDGAAIQVEGGGQRVVTATNGGTVTLGAGSVTEVAPDTTSKATAVDDQPQPQSVVEVNGKQIHLQANSAIIAHGGAVNINAEANPSLAGIPVPPNDQVSIDMAAGSLIDVSGGSVDVAMARNQVSVQLRGNELRDSPLQRDGFLRGQTVTIDARVGTPLADVSGYVAGSIRRDVTERLGKGGSVTLTSEGSVNLAGGSKIDISGGVVNYAAGFVDTSKLVSNGRLYDIGSAPADVVYSAIFGGVTIFDPKWGTTRVYPSQMRPTFQPAYTQGLDAGSVQIAGRTLHVDGDISAHTVNGIYQRSATTLPKGGTLTIGLPTGLIGGNPDYVAPSLWLAASGAGGAPADTTNIDAGRYASAGVSNFLLFSDGSITLPAGNALVLPAHGRLSLTAPTINLNSDVTASGGTISANVVDLLPGVSLSADPRLSVGDGVDLNVSGGWVNDFGNGADTTPLMLNGGSVSLRVGATNGHLELGQNVELQADSGATVNTTGALTGGNGGSLTLATTGLFSEFSIGAGTSLHAYGVVGGGSLTLTAPSVAVVNADTALGDVTFGQTQVAAAGTPLQLSSGMFDDGGFASYAINANQGELRVRSGAQITPITATRQIGPEYVSHATGDDLGAFSTIAALPDYLRKPASISLATPLLNANFSGDLIVETGAVLRTEPQGRISLAATGGRMFIDGLLSAPAGSISVSAGQISTQPFDPSFAVWLGAHSLLDVSGVVTRAPAAGDAGTELSVLGAGNLSIFSSGYVVTETGSRVLANGASATGDLQTVGYIDHLLDRSGGNRQTVGSSGGSIAVAAGEGFILDGSIEAKPGATGYAAGDLSLTVDHGLRGGDFQNPIAGFPATPAQLIVTSSDSRLLPAGAAFGDALSADAYSGRGVVSVDELNASGVDSLTLQGDQIVFSGADPVTLNMARQLTLFAPQVKADGPATVTLNAPSLTMQSLFKSPAVTATAGTAALVANAANIDLVGAIALSGFYNVSLLSSGDIRLRGAPDRGALTSTGRLTLGARRIYPATMSSFAINVLDSSAGQAIIDIEPAGAPLGAGDQLLSAGGNLSMSASAII